MSVVVQMDGLPANAESNAVVAVLRKILQKLKIRFWVHDLTNSEATNTKTCKIEFFNKSEVQKAIERIMSNPHTIMGVPCDLKITILSETSEKDAEKQKKSKSPLSKEEAKLDEEIEQLKKEKEELEKRKNALLRKKLTIDLEGKPPFNHHVECTVLPKNTTAENIILEQMKPLMKSLQQKRFYQLMLQRIHVDVRKRLAVLVENNRRLGHKVTTAKDIVKAYRHKHSKATDAELVDTIKQEIKMAFWAYRAKNADGTKGEGYEYDESSDEESNPPAEKKARTSDLNEDSEKTPKDAEEPQVSENVEKKDVKNEEPKNSETEQTKASEIEQPTNIENEEPKPTENEQPKALESETAMITENEEQKAPENVTTTTQIEEPKVSQNEEPKDSEQEKLKLPEIEEPKDSDNGEPKLPENEEPKDSNKGELKLPENEEPKVAQTENSQDEHLFEGGSDWNDEGTKLQASHTT